MDSYEAVLDNAVRNVEALITEIDTEVRAEFPECEEGINDIIDGLRGLDLNDYWHLMAQLSFTQAAMKLASECTCTDQMRFHVCLSRVNTALMKSAYHTNIGMMKIVAEQVGVDFDDIHVPKFEEVDALAPIIDLPSGINFTVPDSLEFEVDNDNGN